MNITKWNEYPINGFMEAINKEYENDDYDKLFETLFIMSDAVQEKDCEIAAECLKLLAEKQKKPYKGWHKNKPEYYFNGNYFVAELLPHSKYYTTNHQLPKLLVKQAGVNKHNRLYQRPQKTPALTYAKICLAWCKLNVKQRNKVRPLITTEALTKEHMYP